MFCGTAEHTLTTASPTCWPALTLPNNQSPRSPRLALGLACPGSSVFHLLNIFCPGQRTYAYFSPSLPAPGFCKILYTHYGWSGRSSLRLSGHAVPCQAGTSAERNSHPRGHLERLAPDKRSRSDDAPERVSGQRSAQGLRRAPAFTPRTSVDVPDEEQLPDGDKYKSRGRSVETSDDGSNEWLVSPARVEGDQGEMDRDPRREDPQPAEESSEHAVGRVGENTEGDGKVEVGSGESLKNGKCQEEVSGADPS